MLLQAGATEIVGGSDNRKNEGAHDARENSCPGSSFVLQALSVNGRARLEDVTDGTANTLLVVEGPASNPWASPATTVAVRTLLPGEGGGRHRGGANVATADGAVHFLRAEAGLRTAARLATRAGG